MTNDIAKKRGKGSTEKKTRRKVKRRETYAMYIYKVLKQVSGSAKLYLDIIASDGKRYTK